MQQTIVFNKEFVEKTTAKLLDNVQNYPEQIIEIIRTTKQKDGESMYSAIEQAFWNYKKDCISWHLWFAGVDFDNLNIQLSHTNSDGDEVYLVNY